MWFVILSVICSVTVGIFLKVAKRFQLNVFQIITFNYFSALLLTYFTYQPELTFKEKTIPYSLFIGLAILLPIVFLIQAKSIKEVGIVKTDIAQRLSLFIPLTASYFLFNETFSQLKIIGFIVGFSAIFFTLNKKSESKSDNWVYPLLVLLGFGIIDILFKKVAVFKDISFTTSLFIIFCGAFLISILFLIGKILVQKEKLESKNILWGLALGILNFGNILFYLKAHKALAENPSTVFAGMNMGVIILGSLAGILLFKEKMTKWNYLGISLAIISVVIITIAQLNKV
ncbi:DMT family transporter [Flavobacterium proteolyticum]|uniref:DMT family transporter n=1 Tax=Flavobacterium proteolyticum TaxID=2911683 RepID=A0ABR9WT49_9FLAO|nr:DMT family transporter [Flavobacterium proteolyticum]MBE9576756.1 DMT family transporter [Flavobacterium proteolyticum]